MLEKDVLYMLDSDWEPKVPTSDEIRKQSESFHGRLAGSVRLVLGRVVGSEYKTTYNQKET